MAHSVVVVGAGAAGLGAALALRERGIEPLLIDAEDRAGGKLGTEVRRGFLMERAARSSLLGRASRLAVRLTFNALGRMVPWSLAGPALASALGRMRS